jgi:hypothetical protein
VLVENSEFDHNMVGFATGDLNNDDAPGPQDGTCPGGARNPHSPPGIQRTNVCWVFINNYVHDNNNPNVPSAGIAAQVPVGTGLLVYGGRHDVFIGNRFVRNGAWGVLFTPYPDTEQPPPVAHCNGGQDLSTPGSPLCYYDDWGSELAFNTFTDNGDFGNPSNGDIGELSQVGGPAGPNYNPDSNCFHDNSDTAGLTSDPANIDSFNHCGQTNPPANDPILTDQVQCDTQLAGPCPNTPGHHYPRASNIALPLPPAQPTMPNPCAGVPADPWCNGAVTVVRACVRGRFLRAPAALAPRERLIRLSVRLAGRRHFSVIHHHRSVTIKLARRLHGRLRATFLELIRVRRHFEAFTFVRVYHGC